MAVPLVVCVFLLLSILELIVFYSSQLRSSRYPAYCYSNFVVWRIDGINNIGIDLHFAPNIT